MAGWASNNKYALLGSLRSSSQMISYELSMGLSVIGIIMAFASVHLGDIAVGAGQHRFFSIGPVAIPKWGIFIQPLGFLIFTDGRVRRDQPPAVRLARRRVRDRRGLSS